MATNAAPRRYLRTRERRWAGALARGLARAGVRPNAVSVMSVVVAAAAGWCFWASARAASPVPLLVGAAAGIQLRLLCNMLDGLLAVEGGLKSALGDIYNDLPDRLADALILVGAGYALRDQAGAVALGWAAAVLAVMTAYVRVLAGSLGATQRFLGPMAKQHRMFVMTVGALVAAVEHAMRWPSRALVAALVIVVVGSALTTVRRTLVMAREIRAR
jgi:phosphatidylglycerophosphate synthase